MSNIILRFRLKRSKCHYSKLSLLYTVEGTDDILIVYNKNVKTNLLINDRQVRNGSNISK